MILLPDVHHNANITMIPHMAMLIAMLTLLLRNIGAAVAAASFVSHAMLYWWKTFHSFQSGSFNWREKKEKNVVECLQLNVQVADLPLPRPSAPPPPPRWLIAPG